MRHLFIVSIVLIVCAPSHSADAPNAADTYKQAIAAAQSLPKEVTDLLINHDAAKPLSLPLSPAELKLLELTADLPPLLAKARDIKACDWKYPQGAPWEFPEGLGGTRHLCRVVNYRAACLRAQGKPRQAIDEMLAAWAMGRRIGDGGSIICVLVQMSIDGMYVTAFAAIAPAMSKEDRAHLVAQLPKLPAGETLKSASVREVKGFDRFLREDYFKDIDGHTDNLIEMMRGAHALRVTIRDKGPDAFDETGLKSIAKIAKREPERFKKLLDAMTALLMEGTKIYELPLDEHEAFNKKLKDGIDKTNPLIEHLTSDTLKGLAGTQTRVNSMNAMLVAGLAYLDGGEAAFAKVLEPGTKQPFEFEKTEAGFTLRSRIVKTGDEKMSVEFGLKPAEP